ncbi:MAG: DNA-formamidopyrimidine glycosylase family protein [Solirubrobacteraceae bacterium]|nr:DNA-formamidopyrimidine glycosylase family protein [Solirubrobacteraceae bacterium]
MPEGDTIAYAANRIRPILLGEQPQIEARHGSLRGWGERLTGRTIEAVEPYGKHLFLRFEGDLTVHSHLKMTGSWYTGLQGARWRRAPRRAWLVLRAKGYEVVQFDGPLLELSTGLRSRIDRRVARLGPDILAEEFDYDRFFKRLREDDATRPIGDAILDQQTVAGIGNMWKAEALFDVGLDPWRPLSRTTDDEVRAVIEAVRPRMADSARGGTQMRERHVYRLPKCITCRGEIASRGQGDDNRTTYWCPVCQR